MGAPPSHRASLLTLRPTLAAGIPAALQRYVHAGRQLVDDRPLAEQRVAPAATLDLRLSLLGGAPKKKGKEKGDKPKSGGDSGGDGGAGGGDGGGEGEGASAELQETIRQLQTEVQAGVRGVLRALSSPEPPAVARRSWSTRGKSATTFSLSATRRAQREREREGGRERGTERGTFAHL